MKLEFDMKDLLYLVVIAVFAFLLLSQVKDIPLSSYASLADAKEKGIAPAIDIVYFPIFIGVALSIVLYLLLRSKFKSLPVLIAVILMVSSGAFIKNFIFGSFSLPVSILFGEINLPTLIIKEALQKLSETILLLPFAIFTLIYLIYKKKYDNKMKILALVFSIIGIIASLIFPLLALPFLAVCAAYVLQEFKENKEENILLGCILIFGVVLFIIPSVTPAAVGLAVLSVLVIALLLYLTEMRHKINILLILVIVALSISGSAINIFSVQRIDTETIAALSQLSQVKGKVAVVSIYDEIAPATYYLSGKTINASEGLRFVFSEDKSRGFDYLLIDTLVLDDPKNYSAKVNQTAKFETFGYARTTGISTEEGNYTGALFYSKSNVMIMPVDEKGVPISDKVQVGGDWVSRLSLLELNATGGYHRFILPKGDTNKNILKVLFPDQLLYNESQLVWQSNNSRMRLYKFG